MRIITITAPKVSDSTVFCFSLYEAMRELLLLTKIMIPVCDLPVAVLPGAIYVQIDSDLPSLSTELVFPLDLPQTPPLKILPIFVVSEGFFAMYCIHGNSPIWIPIQVMYDSYYHDSARCSSPIYRSTHDLLIPT